MCKCRIGLSDEIVCGGGKWRHSFVIGGKVSITLVSKMCAYVLCSTGKKLYGKWFIKNMIMNE